MLFVLCAEHNWSALGGGHHWFCYSFTFWIPSDLQLVSQMYQGKGLASSYWSQNFDHCGLNHTGICFRRWEVCLSAPKPSLCCVFQCAVMEWLQQWQFTWHRSLGTGIEWLHKQALHSFLELQGMPAVPTRVLLWWREPQRGDNQKCLPERAWVIARVVSSQQCDIHLVINRI